MSQPPGVRLFCEVCKVGATSQQQLDMHLNGKAHRARVEGRGPHSGNRGQQNQQLSRPPQSTPSAITPSNKVRLSQYLTQRLNGSKSDIILRIKLFQQGKDLSIYRTPSGQFYCSPCNLSLNSESQFTQHCDSKKHKRTTAGAGGGSGAAARGRGSGRGRGGGFGMRGRGGGMRGGGSSGFSYS